MQTAIQSVGNVQQAGDMISTLAAIRGSDTAGNASKRRRFADQGMQAFAIAQRVAASKLKEANEDKIPDDECGQSQVFYQRACIQSLCSMYSLGLRFFSVLFVTGCGRVLVACHVS